MLETDMVTIMVFAIIAMVVGGTGSIIVLVHCVLQGTSQSLTPFLIIAFTLCMSNLFLICFHTINDFVAVFGETYPQHLSTLLDRVSMPFLCYSLWLSTWLSLYYQIKIVPTLSKLYLWLKMRFNNVLPWFMFFSGLLSITVGFCIEFDDMHGLFSNSCNFSSGNGIGQRPLLTNENSLQVQVYCAFVSLSFLITLRSVASILSSLYKHVHHMRCKSSEFTNTSLEAHYTAAKTVASLLVFNFLLFLSQVVGYLQNDLSSVSMLTSVALSALLTICPYILINANSKLKLQVKGTLQWIFHGLRMRNFLAD